MADRVAVMSRGRIEQIASPTDIYDRPETLFVNQFVGSTNVLEAVAGDGNRPGSVTLAGGEVLEVSAGAALAPGARVRVSIRPEHLGLHSAPAPNAIAGTIKAALPLGPHVLYDIAVAGGADLKVSVPRKGGDTLLPPGANVFAAPAPPAMYRAFPV